MGGFHVKSSYQDAFAVGSGPFKVFPGISILGLPGSVSIHPSASFGAVESKFFPPLESQYA
jgi:hypothetical protein